MGNNHNQYFGDTKRKILLLGLEGAGKTTLLRFLETGKMIRDTEKTREIDIKDKKMGKLQISFFDLPGGQRQRVFWKQNYKGSQGVIFLVDSSNVSQMPIALQELKKCLEIPELSAVPFAIAISKVELAPSSQLKSTRASLQQLIKASGHKAQVNLFQISCTDSKSVDQMMVWLVNTTHAL